MTRSTRRPAGVVLVLLLAGGLGTACSPAGTASGSGNRDLITREQILERPNQSAFQVIERLRPQWLRARTQGTFSNPTPEYALVYLDGVRFGDLSSLDRIRANDIDRIEYIGGLDATTRYGTGAGGGVIHIRRARAEPND